KGRPRNLPCGRRVAGHAAGVPRRSLPCLGSPPPCLLPLWTISSAAGPCEAVATVTGRPSPLTRGFIRTGRVSHWGDTKRFREELLPVLKHPRLASGLGTL